MEREFCWHSEDTFEGIGEFELIVLYVEVTLVYDY